MFFNPETGIDIDGAWIDMNEPSSVIHLFLFPGKTATEKCISSAIILVLTPSSLLESKRCHQTGRLYPRIQTHLSLVRRLICRNAHLQLLRSANMREIIS